MDFFNSLTLDLKVIVVAIAGCALLMLFSGNRSAEKRYLVVIALLAVAGAYRFSHVAGDDQAARSAAQRRAPQGPIVPDRHTPLASTAAH